MTRYFLLAAMVLGPALVAAHGNGQATVPGFTISAGKVTMPTSGDGVIPFTLASTGGFSGSIEVTCTPPSPPAGVREPQCGPAGPVAVPPPIALAANATATGEEDLLPYVYLPPSTSSLHRERHGRGAVLSLAGVLAIGLGFARRRSSLRVVSGTPLLALGTLVGVMALSGCGGGLVDLTPGTYTYTLTAAEEGSPASSASTTVQVTVPPGIVAETAPTPF